MERSTTGAAARRRLLGGLAALTTAAAVTVAGAPGSASAASALTLKTMTFNICGNTKPPADTSAANATCIYGQHPSEIGDDVGNRITTLHPDTNVVFLQEVCYADLTAIKSVVGSSWQFRFTGIKDEGSGSSPTGTVAPRACAGGQGNFGIAIGVKTSASNVAFTLHYYPDSHTPMARDQWNHWDVHQAAICGDVTSWKARVCGTHLTPATSSESSVFHTAQAGQVKDLVGYAGTGSRVIVGGDLNSAPPAVKSDSTVGPLYDAFTECDQANYGGARNGTKTYQNADGTRSSKLDYIFASKSATTSCYVTTAHVKASDHVPVTATTVFPAS